MNNTASTYTEYERQRKTLFAKISEATEAWFVRACQNPALPQFLFYKPGALDVVIEPKPPGAEWVQADPTPVSCAMTQPQIRGWAHEKLKTCPVYPT